jgi:8-oxo-dGTP pyrophosphatase MutT (NUDIX family)
MRSSLCSSIRETLEDWIPFSSQETALRDVYLHDISPQRCDRMSVHPGHFTASGFIRTWDRKWVLLVFHPHLQKWIQPGGHLESVDKTVFCAAKREIEEETGLVNVQWDGMMRLDLHQVPQTSKQMPHQHWDMQFGFEIEKSTTLLTGGLHAKWVRYEELDRQMTDASVLRFLEGWL